MRCFYHTDGVAVGICKNCGRGLCEACAVEIPDGLACLNRCERVGSELASLISRNRRLSGKGGARAVYTVTGGGLLAIAITSTVVEVYSKKPNVTFYYGASYALLCFSVS